MTDSELEAIRHALAEFRLDDPYYDRGPTAVTYARQLMGEVERLRGELTTFRDEVATLGSEVTTFREENALLRCESTITKFLLNQNMELREQRAALTEENALLKRVETAAGVTCLRCLKRRKERK